MEGVDERMAASKALLVRTGKDGMVLAFYTSIMSSALVLCVGMDITKSRWIVLVLRRGNF